MNKDALKEMIKSIMQEIVDEDTLGEQDAVLRERSAQARANKVAKNKLATLRAADRYAPDFLPKFKDGYRDGGARELKRQGRDLEKGMGTGTLPNDPRNRPDMKTMMSDPLQRRAAGAKAGARGITHGPNAAQKSAVSQQAAQQGLKKIPGTFGLYSKSGSAPAEFRSSKGALVPVKSSLGLSESNTGMIRLTNLLNESMIERRVNLVRVQTVLEKLYPELNETQTKKIMELCTEAHMVASQLNTTRYVRTESSLMEWKLLALVLDSKLSELKEEVVKACETKKIDSTTVVKALETVLEY